MSELPAALEQAIEWHARQASGQFSEGELRAFERWLAADQSHAAAWNVLRTRLDQTFSHLSGSRARQVLSAGTSRRHLLRGALAVGGCTLTARLLTWPGMPLDRLTADVATANAQRQTLVLVDGSSLTLNAESAIDVSFTASMRTVRLLRGGLMARIEAQDRPFQLGCRDGSVQLTSGQCVLSQYQDHTQFWLKAGTAQIRSQRQTLVLTAGQGARLDGLGVHPLPVSQTDPGAWVRGLLEVSDQSLAEVVDRLRPYRRGVLQVSDAAASLRISGVFNLDNSDQALAALKDILPLRIDHYWGLWTRIDRV
ncbi:FecR domain-containing protein [Pseudomonas viridiflava]|uniref:FecR domain-containing protein n=1 Tax=Pseudomonas viridiflava TaxID=33069 RepID=UPI000F04C5DA|nr:FecR domain-containing protein [Pseudomonas viridiflava]